MGGIAVTFPFVAGYVYPDIYPGMVSGSLSYYLTIATGTDALMDASIITMNPSTKLRALLVALIFFWAFSVASPPPHAPTL